MNQPGTGETARFRPEATLVISDLETLRMLTDPLRLRIMEAFARDADTPQTVKRVAATLGEGATKLYYHVGLLEERGLLRATESRVVSGIIETRYQPTARAITVDRTVLGGAMDANVTDALGATMGAILDSVRDDVIDGIRSGRILAGPDVSVRHRAVLARTIGRLSTAQAERFLERLRALHDELDAVGEDGEVHGDGDAAAYALTMAFYPSRPQAEEEPG